MSPAPPVIRQVFSVSPTVCRHQRCPGPALRAADSLLHRRVGRHHVPASPRHRLACCPPHHAYSMGMEGSAGGGCKAEKPLLDHRRRARREALAQRQDGLVASSRGGYLLGCTAPPGYPTRDAWSFVPTTSVMRRTSSPRAERRGPEETRRRTGCSIADGRFW